ncbi:MAG: aminopeptidase [Pseudomonadota bacterium]
MLKTLRFLGLAILMLAQAGCETLTYYGQAIQGQWQIMRAARPVEQALQQTDLAETTRQQLQLTQDVLAFAEAELLLPSEGRYRKYAALSRDYVVWNVFAAEPYDLTGKQWCYPIVGCAPYRGYFKEARAEAAALDYRAEGLETYVGPVPAYSTLGWFKDPLLSTFVHWPEPDLAQLLIHELAHSRLWIKNDVALNESFASFVGRQGTAQWFTSRGQSQVWLEYEQRQQIWYQLRDLLLDTRQQLAAVYADTNYADKGYAEKDASVSAAKRTIMQAAQTCYAQHKALLGGGRYDPLMQQLNNALLVSLSTYADWQPALEQLFRQHNSQWPAFYQAMEDLGGMPADQRQQVLQQLLDTASAQQEETHQRDHQHTSQVNCQSF